jgi:hypothetical protein
MGYANLSNYFVCILPIIGAILDLVIRKELRAEKTGEERERECFVYYIVSLMSLVICVLYKYFLRFTKPIHGSIGYYMKLFSRDMKIIA